MLHPSIFFWLKQWLQRSVLESRMLSIPLTALPLCPIHPNTSYSRQYFIYTSFIHLFIHSFEEHSKNIPVNQRVVKEQTFYSKNKPICQVLGSDWSDEKYSRPNMFYASLCLHLIHISQEQRFISKL